MMKGKYDDCYNVSDDAVISASYGNNKVGEMIGINTLAGESPYVKKDGTVLCTIKGTCEGCCEECEPECYARNYIMRKHNTCLPAYIKNTAIMRKDLQNFVDQIVNVCRKAKEKYKYVRYHESGEFETLMQMVGVNDVAIRVPRKRYYFYSKKFRYMEIIEESGGFADNVSALASIWYTKGKRNYDNPYHFPEFIYDDGSVPELDHIFHCPAVFIDGSMNHNITCQKCGRCPNAKKGQQTCVYAHGRTKWHRDGVDVKEIAKQQKAKWNTN